MTAPRLAVLTAVLGEGQHRDAETIAEAARQQLGTLSTQAVYDNLRVLEAAGLVRRIQPSGHSGRYEARVGDNHHHVVCRRCGATADVDCAVGAAPCLEPSAKHGFLSLKKPKSSSGASVPNAGKKITSKIQRSNSYERYNCRTRRTRHHLRP